MPIVVTCPECQAKIKAPEHAIGKQIKCPKCSAKFTATSNASVTPPPSPLPPPPPAAAPEQDTVREEGSSGFSDIEVPPLKPAPKSAPAPKGNDDFDDMPLPPVRRRGSGPATFADYLTFRAFITPVVLQFLFWLGVLFYCYVGGRTILFGVKQLDFSVSAGLETIAYGAGGIIAGLIGWRVVCETILVFFRIHESVEGVQDNVRDIRRNS